MRRTARPVLLAALPLLLAALTVPAHGADAFAADFAGPIEEAQGKEAFFSHRAVAADLVLHFGGNRVLDGTLTFTPDTRGSRIDLDGGAVAGWNGSTAWVSPADAEVPRARFHVLTWPYFLAAPFKLRNPGANLEDLGAMELRGETYDAAKLTFDPGTGDTPDDWYVVYRDRETDRLAALAYVVTYGTSLEAAEEEPHAITYHDYETVDGATLPTTWKFWLWSEEEGIHGDQLGSAELSNLRFVEPDEGIFEVPADARKEGLPEGE